MLSIFRRPAAVAATKLKRPFSDNQTQEPSSAAKLLVISATFGSGFVAGSYSSKFVINTIEKFNEWCKNNKLTTSEIEKIECGFSLNDNEENQRPSSSNGM